MTTESTVKWATFGNEEEEPKLQESTVPTTDIIQTIVPQPQVSIPPPALTSKRARNGRKFYRSMSFFTLFTTLVIFILLVICVSLLVRQERQSTSSLDDMAIKQLLSYPPTSPEPEPTPTPGQDLSMLFQALNMLELLIKESGWYEASNGMIYKIFNGRYVNFEQANRSCSNLGGRLAASAIRDPNLRREILPHLTPVYMYSNTWIGLHDIKEEGFWEWSDGVISNSTKIPWARGQPSNYTSYFYQRKEDCAVISFQGFISDTSCSTLYPHMCEIPMPF